MQALAGPCRPLQALAGYARGLQASIHESPEIQRYRQTDERPGYRDTDEKTKIAETCFLHVSCNFKAKRFLVYEIQTEIQTNTDRDTEIQFTRMRTDTDTDTEIQWTLIRTDTDRDTEIQSGLS